MSDNGPATGERDVARTGADPVIDAATVELLPEAVVVLDRAGRMLSVNRATARLLGARAADCEDSFERFVAPESAADWSTVVEALGCPEEMPRVFSLDLINGDGHLVPVELVLGAAGSHVLAVVRDVTAHRAHESLTQRMLSDLDEHRARVELQAEQFIKQAEDLHVSERRLALILESTRDAYWDWDITTGTLDFNAHFAAALGITGGTAESLAAFHGRVHREERAAVVACFAAAQRGEREDIAPGEFRVLHGNGRFLWVIAKGQVVTRDSGGQPRRAVGMLSNVNDRKVRDEEQQRLRRLESVGGLAAGVAHEINTPLQMVGDNLTFLADNLGHVTSVLTSLERVREDAEAWRQWRAVAGEEVADAICSDLAYLRVEFPEAIRDSIEGIARVSRIVRALKEFAHPGQTEREDVDLRRVIENAVTLTRGEWRHVATVDTIFDDLPTIVMGSQSDCTQLVANLIVNAAQAIASQRQSSLGRILVRADVDGSDCLIVVSDNGPGMSAEVMAQAFDPFFTTKAVGQGTGQGLPLARAIAQRHGGAIGVESTPGFGAVFAVRLPGRRT